MRYQTRLRCAQSRRVYVQVKVLNRVQQNFDLSCFCRASLEGAGALASRIAHYQD